MIDCLLIAPGNSQSIYQNLSTQYSAIEPPIWASLLANALRHNHKKEVHLVDMAAQSPIMLNAIVEDTNPKLIVVVVYGQQPSASTQNMHSAGKICESIKKEFPDKEILMVGGHVSALPELTLQQEKCDYVAKGEGLNPIIGLLNEDRPQDIAGLWYRRNTRDLTHNTIEHGPKDTIATNLAETFPGQAWDLLPMGLYRAHNWQCFGHLEDRNSYASIYTSLGCPFKCTFCCINAPFDGSSFRYWDPQFTVREIEHLVTRYGVRNLKIADEMFVLNESHFLKLCNLIIERSLALNIWAYARVDTVKPRYLETLKKAGVNWLALGIESGSKHVRDGVIKGRFGQEDIVGIVKQIKDAGIHIIGNYIFGLPDDTLKSMEETYSMAVDLQCEMANFYCAQAYPGSKLYDDAILSKRKLPDTWLGYSQHSYETYPLSTDTLTSGQVLAFRDKAFHEYFANPSYQSMIRGKFGGETLRHIEGMIKIKLKRQFADESFLNSGV